MRPRQFLRRFLPQNGRQAKVDLAPFRHDLRQGKALGEGALFLIMFMVVTAMVMMSMIMMNMVVVAMGVMPVIVQAMVVKQRMKDRRGDQSGKDQQRRQPSLAEAAQAPQ